MVLQTRHPFIIGIFSREPDLRSLYDSIFFSAPMICEIKHIPSHPPLDPVQIGGDE